MSNFDFVTKKKEICTNFRNQSTLSTIDECTNELWVEKFAPRAFCDLLSDIVSFE